MTDVTKRQETRNTRIDMQITSFCLPPSGDVLVIGQRSPMGPEAAKRMLDSVAPGQFEWIKVDDDVVAAIFVRAHILLRANREALTRAILEEARPIMGSECMLTIRCDVTISVGREI